MGNLTGILIIIGIIALFFIEGLLEITILSIPGAFIRWLAGGKKKKFKEYYREKARMNTILGLLILIAIFIIVLLIASLFA
jgi:hypothetical protein